MKIIYYLFIIIRKTEIKNCKSSYDVDSINGPSLFTIHWSVQFSQFSRSIMSDSLWPHEPQHAWPPCPSPTPRVYSYSCPLSQWCHPTILSSALNLSQHQDLLQWVNTSIRWPKYWSFSFSIIPSKKIPGLISFRMDCSDLFAVQGTLKSLLQHHSSKASILQRSAFFIVQISHSYVTTEKNHSFD